MIDDGPDPDPATPQPLSDPFQTHAVAMVDHLNATGPWARFLAIVGFCLAGLMALLSLVVLAVSPFMEQGALGPLMSLLYMLGAVVYVIPCVHLYRFASSIAAISRGGGPRAMAEALDHQRRFWRVMGILTIVVLCLYVAGIAAGLLAAILFGLPR